MHQQQHNFRQKKLSVKLALFNLKAVFLTKSININC